MCLNFGQPVISCKRAAPPPQKRQKRAVAASFATKARSPHDDAVLALGRDRAHECESNDCAHQGGTSTGHFGWGGGVASGNGNLSVVSSCLRCFGGVLCGGKQM